MLEAMASGVPLVTTRVGQAQEIVEHGTNGWLVDVERCGGARDRVICGSTSESYADRPRTAARATAEQYALERLDTAWEALLEGFADAHEHG